MTFRNDFWNIAKPIECTFKVLQVQILNILHSIRVQLYQLNAILWRYICLSVQLHAICYFSTKNCIRNCDTRLSECGGIELCTVFFHNPGHKSCRHCLVTGTATIKVCLWLTGLSSDAHLIVSTELQKRKKNISLHSIQVANRYRRIVGWRWHKSG